MQRSASAQILASIVTASIGFWPLAVSFVKTTASAPSRTTHAISYASVRVGLIDLVILSRH
jgi:hypothetical protein